MICFVVHFYKDIALTVRLLRQLRLYYHQTVADIIVIGDGMHSAELMSLSFVLKYRYLTFERLKLVKFGGKWTERYLEAFLVYSKASILIKVDPDSYVSRPFAYYPTEDIFGTINTKWFYPFVRGGCIGIWRGTARKIIESALLQKADFTEKEFYAYQRFLNFRWENEEKSDEWVSLQDRILGVVAVDLSLTLNEWQEVDIQFRDYMPRNVDNRYAVVHPVPFSDGR